jgi:hypothetical protein
MVDGRMFDLESYSVTDEVFTGIGLYDDKETQVMALLNQFNDDEQNRLIIRLFLFTQCLLVLTAVALPVAPLPLLRQKFRSFQLFYINPFFEPLRRPPRFFHFSDSF